MKIESLEARKIGPDLFSAGAARRDVKILSDLDSAGAHVDPGSDVVGSRAAMLLFFAVVIPAVFMLALWHREQTEALEVRMSPANAELQSVVGREAKIAQQDTLAGSSVGDGGAADGAARIVSSSVPQPAERAMPPKQTATSVPIRAPSDASTASRDAGGVRHAADQPPRAAAKSAGAARAEQSQRRPLTRAQAAATQGSSAGIASRSSEQAGPTGPVTVAAESDGIQRDLEIITAIVRASSR